MPGGSRTSHGDIPLPTLNVSKENDYVQAIPHIDTDAKPRENAIEPGTLDGNSSDDTVTDLSDFDWDAEDDAQSHKEGVKVKAKRIGAIWRGFMKLARPVRTLLIGALGAGIFITPLLVFKLRFNSSPVRIQAHVWSLWLTITWAAGCITYLLVDLIPSFILRFLKIANYRIERIQITIEVRHIYPLTFCFWYSYAFGLAHKCCIGLAQIGSGYSMGMDSSVCNPCNLSSAWLVLDYREPCHSGRFRP